MIDLSSSSFCPFELRGLAWPIDSARLLAARVLFVVFTGTSLKTNLD